MNKIASLNGWSKLVWGLVIANILFSLWLTGHFIFFSSNFVIWTDKNKSSAQKLGQVLGTDYLAAQKFAWLPKNSGILIVSSDDIWFCNYYFLPRRMYTYPGTTKDEQVAIPKPWLKSKRINFLFLYHIPLLRILHVDKNWNFEFLTKVASYE
ncbi:MAG: hypothetical protein PHG97_00840 [Candidatus Margulisbacteria bacterium]|nr:hypothetical protein [Candidatus Margulisiibacteriota bacterium]